MLSKVTKPPHRLMVILIFFVVIIILIDQFFILKTHLRRNRWEGDHRPHQKPEQIIKSFAEVRKIPGDSKDIDSDGSRYRKTYEEDKLDGSDEKVQDESKTSHDEDEQDIAFENSDRDRAGDSMYYNVDHHHQEASHVDHVEEDPALKIHGQSGNDIGKSKEVEVGGMKEDSLKQKPAVGRRKGRGGIVKEGEVSDDFSGQWNITEEIRRMAPVIFKLVPPKFHPDYKGFCWYNAAHEFRCLAYFYLLGMPKCGTTDIWDHIVYHPYIVRVLKEPHWWTRHNRNMVRAYISRSKSTIRLMEKRPEYAGHYVLGDGSASYLWDMRRWQEYFDPDHPDKQLFLPHVIKTVTPKAKFIAAFREPAARLYSEYLYFSKDPTPESFHERVVQQIEHFQHCTTQFSERKCVYQIAMESGDIRPMIGIYSVFARDWLDVFPREQMMFIRLEDWHQHCEEYLPKIYSFLEAGTLPLTSIRASCRVKSKNTNNRKRARVGPILQKTKILLDEFYSRWNQDLADLLQDDRWLWSDVID